MRRYGQMSFAAFASWSRAIPQLFGEHRSTHRLPPARRRFRLCTAVVCRQPVFGSQFHFARSRSMQNSRRRRRRRLVCHRRRSRRTERISTTYSSAQFRFDLHARQPHQCTQTASILPSGPIFCARHVRPDPVQGNTVGLFHRETF